ncbi:hypothetical protein [Dinoroseobacter sp. S124A]|uniref:hypothetical protein n=1 Tax=Dinoroseobacter sp. S124A TaxID=3415128 RepID=UPI003C7B7A1E
MARARLTSVYDLPDANLALAEEIGRKFRARPKDLPEALRRVKGVMPKPMLVELQAAVEAESWLSHPHWHRQIDLGQMQDVHARARRFLDGLNPRRDRERYWLGIAACVVVNLAILAALFVFVAHWRGLI